MNQALDGETIINNIKYLLRPRKDRRLNTDSTHWVPDRFNEEKAYT